LPAPREGWPDIAATLAARPTRPYVRHLRMFPPMCIYRSDRTASASGDSHPPHRPITYESNAHVITQGLGQNDKVFPRGVVCDDCNSYFGTTLEPALMRHPTLASDMQRLGVPGRDGDPRSIIGNWRRSSDGSYWVPMAPPAPKGEYLGKPLIELLPILDPSFDQLEFRRGLHMLAFNELAFLHATGQVLDPAYDPGDPKYDAVRIYIRAPRRAKEAWPFAERYDPQPAIGPPQVQLLSSSNGVIGRIRAYSFEFYVDLMNSGDLLGWIEAQGVTPMRFIPPGVRYPASPTMDEVPPEERWWVRLSDRRMWIGTGSPEPT
jgi:hypothetical protein